MEPSIGCTFRGSRGATRACYPVLEYHIRFEGEPPRTHSFAEKRPYYFRFEGETHHAGEYQNQSDYFADCLDTGLPAYPDLREGLHTLEIMNALERSLTSGRPVAVAPQV